MPVPSDLAPPASQARPGPGPIFAAAFDVVLLLGVIGLFAVASITFVLGLSTKIHEVRPKDAIGCVAEALVRWGVPGPRPMPPFARERAEAMMRGWIGEEIRFIGGHSSSSGMQGDRRDAYCIEFTPELAARIRSHLPRSAVAREAGFVTSADGMPDWYPERWPEGSATHGASGTYLVMPKQGTRAWYVCFQD